MMRVQAITTSIGLQRYIVVDAKGDMVLPIARYLRFLDNIKKSRNTLRGYAYDLALFWRYLDEAGVGFKDAANLDTMAAFIRWLHAPSHSSVISVLPPVSARTPTTVNRIVGTVTNFYDYFWRHGELDNDVKLMTRTHLPAYTRKYLPFLHHVSKHKSVEKNILMQPLSKGKPETLTRSQIETLINACNNSRDKLLISLLFLSALRVGEALALWIEDIAADDYTLEVKDRGELINGAEIKTRSSERVVHVPRSLIHQIMDYLATDYNGDSPSNHLFLKLRGPRVNQPMSYPEVADLFLRLKQKTKIFAWPHILRHSSLTELYANGLRPEALQKHAGHRQYQTTVRYYVHPNPHEMRVALESLQNQNDLRFPKE